MKSVLITYNQILEIDLIEVLDRLEVRGFNRWNDVQGRGTTTGAPHMGTHTWPALNGVVLCVVENERVAALLEALKELDDQERGLRAFVWAVEEMI